MQLMIVRNESSNRRRPEGGARSRMLTISIWTWQHLRSSAYQSSPNQVVP